jgi:hypothetical protein
MCNILFMVWMSANITEQTTDKIMESKFDLKVLVPVMKNAVVNFDHYTFYNHYTLKVGPTSIFRCIG